ncbi:MAG: pyridoxal phosphate-dependent aminotransferase [Paludibacteraceae bacterium]|nr:pyridoxal phosphate-dependent aminotransferase [Paludibacteraceae bacterium]
MMEASTRIQSLSASPTLAMAARAAEMKAAGIDVISLSLGEPDFHTPDHIKAAAKQAIDDNITFYAPVPGYPTLRKAISEKLLKENGLQYAPEQVIVSTGGKQALCNALLAVLNPGDECILPTPCWVSYSEMVKLAEAKPVFVPCGIETNFKMTPAQLEAAITPKSRVLILCSPSNPSGSVYSREELAALKEVLMKHPNLLILSDEIYEHINYIGEHYSLAQFPELKERVILVNGVSKAYAMTGWRIGWMAAEPWVVKACQKLQSQYTSCSCSIAMKAAEAAYTGSQECVKEMCEAFQRRRDLVVRLAKDIPGFEVTVPDGAFYLFPKVDSLFGTRYSTPEGEKVIANSDDLAMYFLTEAHVAAVAGSAFMSPECIRFSYATSDELLTEAFRRIKEAVLKLR